MTETRRALESEALRLQPVGIPKGLCPEAMLAYALLKEAHDACFKAPDRDIVGMSHGPFSGVNQVLGLICQMNETIAQQAARIAALQSVPDGGELKEGEEWIVPPCPTCGHGIVRVPRQPFDFSELEAAAPPPDGSPDEEDDLDPAVVAEIQKRADKVIGDKTLRPIPADPAPTEALHAGAEEQYLIWSNEHQLWWGSNGCGYRRTLKSAGRYSRDDAIAICKGARDGWPKDEIRAPSEIPVRASDVLVCASSPTPPVAPQGAGGGE